MSVSRSTIAAIRFGYGLRPGEAPPRDADALLATVARGAAAPVGWPTSSIAERRALFRTFQNNAKRLRDAPAGADARAMRAAQEDAQRELRVAYNRDAHLRVAEVVRSRNGFFERLAVFWRNHFAVSTRTNPMFATAPDYDAKAIRPAVAGRFDALLRAATLHPAMLIYLDQASSVGPNSATGLRRGRGLNENLAREILELHTLGVDGGYDQTDVTEFARLLTGLSFDRNYAFRFRKPLAEPGVKTVLGRRYGRRDAPHTLDDILRALDDIAREPATRRHVSWKLARHFVADDPPTAVVDALEAAWKASDGDLGRVYRALVEHPAVWDRFGEKVKTPFDFVVSALRATAAPDALLVAPPGRKRNTATLGSLIRLGQPLWRPNGPDGWPDDADAWITAEGLARRLEWAAVVGRRLARPALATRPETKDPRTFLEAALADAARPSTRFLVSGAAERWEGFALVFASPEFNRR